MPDVPVHQRFFAELKRRRVFRVMAVYGAVGFVILQVVELLVPALLLPEWTYRLIALLLIVGFPIAIVLAWAFESTPEGVKRTDEASAAELASIAAAPAGKRWPAGILALLATGLFTGAVWMGLRSSGPVGSESTAVGEGLPESSLAEPAASRVSAPAKISAAPRQSVAVLPFADLAGTDDSRAFALGLHDDLMTQLTKVPDLKVTSRTSVMAYADQVRPVQEIAEDLAVGSIVEGGVRTSGGRVRLNVQLIDPATDEHLWAETYDRELTAETVFEIQGEIARAVATALEAELSEETGAALGAVLTENIDAWNAYHEGKLLEERSGDLEHELRTVEAFERAVELDPEFVAAWTRLARARSWLLRQGYSTDTLPARQAVDSLQVLDPGGADAQYAEGVYQYYARGEYEAALEALQTARSLRPGNPEIMQHAGWVMRRLGRWDEAMQLLDRAVRLDPKNAILIGNQGSNNYRLRRYGEGRRQLEMALDIDPAAGSIGAWLSGWQLFAEGDTIAARRTLEAGQGFEAPGWREEQENWLAYMRRDYAGAIDAARRMTGEPAGVARASGVRRVHSRPMRLALAHRMAGNESSSRAWADSAVAMAAEALAMRPEPNPTDLFGQAAMAHALLGVSLALRGEAGDAAQATGHAEEAVRLRGYERDAADGDIAEWLLARTYLLVGRPDDAIAQLEYMASHPGVLGLGDLKLDPLYDGIRDETRFQALIREVEGQVEW
jgi:TolB-like protein/predicted Zn-dependent protease